MTKNRLKIPKGNYTAGSISCSLFLLYVHVYTVVFLYPVRQCTPISILNHIPVIFFQCLRKKQKTIKQKKNKKQQKKTTKTNKHTNNLN